MERNLNVDLLQWKDQKNRKPLLLQGARQVGKTYLLTEFGQKSFKKLHVINFEDIRFKAIFKNGPASLDSILLNLQALLATKININDDLVFFDEIQECPEAIHSLKYFYEKLPKLALVCAGSHIGVSGSNGAFPVGKVDFKTLYPLNFSEFLKHRNPILEEMQKSAKASFNLDDNIHKQLWDDYLLYTLVGGMPEAVSAFFNAASTYDGLEDARKIHLSLLKGYNNDFSKYCSKTMGHKILAIFNSVASQLQAVHDKSSKRFAFKDIISGQSRYSHLEDAIDWLVLSGLVYKTPMVSQPRIPLNAYAKPNLFKLNFLDIGLLNTQLDVPFNDVINQEPHSYKGFIAEQFVNQQMQNVFAKSIYSWTNGRAEIEFVLQINGNIIPVEVKSGKRVKSKSLNSYKQKYLPKLAIKFSANNMRLEDNHLNAPIYMAEYIFAMVQTFLNQPHSYKNLR